MRRSEVFPPRRLHGWRCRLQRRHRPMAETWMRAETWTGRRPWLETRLRDGRRDRWRGRDWHGPRKIERRQCVLFGWIDITLRWLSAIGTSGCHWPGRRWFVVGWLLRTSFENRLWHQHVCFKRWSSCTYLLDAFWNRLGRQYQLIKNMWRLCLRPRWRQHLHWRRRRNRLPRQITHDVPQPRSRPGLHAFPRPRQHVIGRAKIWDRLTRGRTQRCLKRSDRFVKRQALGLQNLRSGAFAVADNSRQNNRTIDVAAASTASCGCRRFKNA